MSSNVQVFLIIITFLEYIGIEKGKIAALAALEEQEQDIIRLFLAQFCGNIRVLKLAFRLDEWTWRRLDRLGGILLLLIHVTGVNRLRYTYAADYLQYRWLVFLSNGLRLVLHLFPFLKILKAWYVAQNILVVVYDRDLAVLVGQLLVRVVGSRGSRIVLLIKPKWISLRKIRPLRAKRRRVSPRRSSPLCIHYPLNLLDFLLNLFKLWLGFRDLNNNALGKVLLLDLNHLMSYRAEIKQVEDVDFQELMVRKLFKGVLELWLLSA